MKNKQHPPTRSKSARHNGRADIDTNRRKGGKPTDETLRFVVSMPAGAFERMAAAVAELERKRQ